LKFVHHRTTSAGCCVGVLGRDDEVIDAGAAGRVDGEIDPGPPGVETHPPGISIRGGW
jgi:hypothetical protein